MLKISKIKTILKILKEVPQDIVCHGFWKKIMEFYSKDFLVICFELFIESTHNLNMSQSDLNKTCIVVSKSSCLVSRLSHKRIFERGIYQI